MKTLNFLIIFLLCSLPSLASAFDKQVANSEQAYLEGVYIPANLQDVWSELSKSLTDEDKMQLMSISEEEMNQFHFTSGMEIRNNWGLRKNSRLAKYFNNMGIHNPDDMSSIILNTFWCHINNKPIRLEERVAYFKEFWIVRSRPPVNSFPEQNLKDIGAQDYDTERGQYLGYIQIYRNSNSGKIWLYENGKEWAAADEAFFAKYPQFCTIMVYFRN